MNGPLACGLAPPEPFRESLELEYALGKLDRPLAPGHEHLACTPVEAAAVERQRVASIRMRTGHAGERDTAHESTEHQP